MIGNQRPSPLWLRDVLLGIYLMFVCTHADGNMIQVHCLNSSGFTLTLGCDTPDVIHVTRVHYGVRQAGRDMDCQRPLANDSDCVSWPTRLTREFRDICNSYHTCPKQVLALSDITLECEASYTDGQPYIYVEYRCIPVNPSDVIVLPMDSNASDIISSARVHLRSEFYPIHAEPIEPRQCHVLLPPDTQLIVEVLQLAHLPTQPQYGFCLISGTLFRHCSSFGGTFTTRRVSPSSQQSVLLHFSPTLAGGSTSGRFWVILAAEGNNNDLTLRVACGENPAWGAGSMETQTFITVTTPTEEGGQRSTHSSVEGTVVSVSSTTPAQSHVEPLTHEAVDVGLVVGCVLSGIVMVLLLAIFITAVCWKHRTPTKQTNGGDTETFQSVTAFQQPSRLYTISESRESDGDITLPDVAPPHFQNVCETSPAEQEQNGGEDTKPILKNSNIYENTGHCRQVKDTKVVPVDGLKAGKCVTWADPTLISEKNQAQEPPAPQDDVAFHSVVPGEGVDHVVRTTTATDIAQTQTQHSACHGDMYVGKDESQDVANAVEENSQKTNQGEPGRSLLSPVDKHNLGIFSTWRDPKHVNQFAKETPAYKGSKAVHKAALRAKAVEKDPGRQRHSRKGKSKADNGKGNKHNPPAKTLSQSDQSNSPPPLPEKMNISVNKRISDETVTFATWASPHSLSSRNKPHETPAHKGSKAIHKAALADRLGKLRKKDKKDPTANEKDRSTGTNQGVQNHSAAPTDRDTFIRKNVPKEDKLGDYDFDNHISDTEQIEEPMEMAGYAGLDDLTAGCSQHSSERQQVRETLQYGDTDYAELVKDVENTHKRDDDGTLYAALPRKPHIPHTSDSMNESTLSLESPPPTLPRRVWHNQSGEEPIYPPTSQQTLPKRASSISPASYTHSLPAPNTRHTASGSDFPPESTPSVDKKPASTAAPQPDTDSISLGSVTSQKSLYASQIIQKIDHMYSLAIAGNDAEADEQFQGSNVYNMVL